MNPSDPELVLLAQSGDAASFGVLLERHRAPLQAMALGYLGHVPDAQDAVQDTFLIALGRIGTLRDPQAVGAWLRSIVRHVCLNRLRTRRVTREAAGIDSIEHVPHLNEPSVEESIDRIALRDWVWTALAMLPEALSVTAMLRYFGSYSSYEEIALILGVPVGTVRSRLHQVRLKLADALLETTGTAHDEARELNLLYRQRFSELCADYNRGEINHDFISSYSPDVAGVFDGAPIQGANAFFGNLREDTVAGVKLHPRSVVVGHDVVIYEAAWENPPEDPFHCPPGMSHIEFHRNGLVRAIRLYHAPRPEGSAA